MDIGGAEEERVEVRVGAERQVRRSCGGLRRRGRTLPGDAGGGGGRGRGGGAAAPLRAGAGIASNHRPGTSL